MTKIKKREIPRSGGKMVLQERHRTRSQKKSMLREAWYYRKSVGVDASRCCSGSQGGGWT